MLKVSALLSLLESHLKIFAALNQPVPAETAATVARLLSSCREHAVEMEALVYPATDEAEPQADDAAAEQATASLTRANIIHVNFPSAASPTGPDVA